MDPGKLQQIDGPFIAVDIEPHGPRGQWTTDRRFHAKPAQNVILQTCKAGGLAEDIRLVLPQPGDLYEGVHRMRWKTGALVKRSLSESVGEFLHLLGGTGIDIQDDLPYCFAVLIQGQETLTMAGDGRCFEGSAQGLTDCRNCVADGSPEGFRIELGPITVNRCTFYLGSDSRQTASVYIVDSGLQLRRSKIKRQERQY